MVLNSDTNTLSNRKEVSNVPGVSKVSATWTVGRFRRFAAGDSVCKVIKGGNMQGGKSQQWRLSFYPKGFTTSDYVSFFVTNVNLEGGSEEKIKTSITITVKMPEQNQAKKGKGKGKGGIMEEAAVMKRLDKTFNSSNHTYGFNKFAGAGEIFDLEKGLVWDVPGNDASKAIDGKLSLLVEIHQFEPLNVEEPELRAEVTAQGWQRVEWQIKDVKGLIEKLGAGQFVSSGEFKANGEWYIDLYPNGYRVEEHMSIFLHSSLRQADRGLQLKRKFRFGLKRQNRDYEVSKQLGEDPDEEAWFDVGASVTAIFNRDQKSAGKQKFMKQSLLLEGRTPRGIEVSKKMRSALAQEFVSGKFHIGGGIALLLDILVLDYSEGQVKQMLHVTPAFKNDVFNVCVVTGRKFGVPVMLGGAKGKPSRCYLCGCHTVPDSLTSGPLTRLPEFGYEVGKDYVMDVLLRESASGQWINNPVKEIKGWMKKAVDKNTALRKVRSGIQSLQARVLSTRDGMLCTGQDRSDSEEEEDEEKWKTMTRRDLERKKREMAMQMDTERRLRILRQDVEDAHYAKPVCAFCCEASRSKAELPVVEANNTSFPGADDDNLSFAAGWKLKLSKAAAAWDGINPTSSSISRNAGTLARGGYMCEPMELARQCSGRCNSDTPMNEDEESDTFCDVRFDRKISMMAGYPKKFHCHGTGKVYCASCVRFKTTLKEHEKDPMDPTPVPVSLEVFQERKGDKSPVLLVSKKKEWSAPSQRKQVLQEDDEDAGDESDDEGLIGFFKSLVDKFSASGDK